MANSTQKIIKINKTWITVLAIIVISLGAVTLILRPDSFNLSNYNLTVNCIIFDSGGKICSES